MSRPTTGDMLYLVDLKLSTSGVPRFKGLVPVTKVGRLYAELALRIQGKVAVVQFNIASRRVTKVNGSTVVGRDYAIFDSAEQVQEQSKVKYMLHACIRGAETLLTKPDGVTEEQVRPAFEALSALVKELELEHAYRQSKVPAKKRRRKFKFRIVVGRGKCKEIVMRKRRSKFKGGVYDERD